MKYLLLSSSKTAIHSWWKDFFNEFTKTLRVHAIFISIIFLYICVLVVADSELKVTNRISFSLYYKMVPLTALWFFVAFLVSHAIYVMVFVRPEKLIKYTLNDLRTNFLNKERLLNGLPIILFIPLFMSAFTSFKTLIPIINPFSWDSAFAKIDALIHGGFQAWKLCQPILGHYLLTKVLNFSYNLWFFVMFGVLYWQSFSLRNLKLRMQFFLSFIMSWVLLGTIAATIFSSAGPCYYGRVVEGDNIYQPLMAYLNKADKSSRLWVLNAQESLWKVYKSNTFYFGSGISAMPSMHVSMAFLFALVGWRSNRLIGIMFSIYFIIILIGSVHLGWHYAIDGYVAILGTLLIWHCVGWFINNEKC